MGLVARFDNYSTYEATPCLAHQQLVPGGYAYAIVLNASHSFNAEASFSMGLHELIAGRTPTIGPPFTFFGVSFGSIADHVVALLTVLSLTIGVVGTVRARAWAAHRASRTTWVTVVRWPSLRRRGARFGEVWGTACLGYTL